MFSLIVDIECSAPNKRKVFENLTVRELGQKLVELSDDYVLCSDSCVSRCDGMFWDIYVTAVDTRIKR